MCFLLSVSARVIVHIFFSAIAHFVFPQKVCCFNGVVFFINQISVSMGGELKVMVVQGRRLVVRDFKSSDPYVILNLGNQVTNKYIFIYIFLYIKIHSLFLFCQTAKTKVINSCLNPVWNQEFHFSISEHAQVLKLVSQSNSFTLYSVSYILNECVLTIH